MVASDWITIGGVKVDPRLMESRPALRCRIEECRALCCSHGVCVDLADAARIVDQADLIKPHLPRDRRDVDNWFDGEVREDGDFPSGWWVGSQVIPDASRPDGTRCLFLRPDNRCALQAASLAEGRDPWDLKPFYCALFPLLLTGDTLELDEDNAVYGLGGTCQRAACEPAPLYSLFKEEMVLALGQDGYDELLAVAAAPSET